MQDKEFYLMELNHYTSLLFEARKFANTELAKYCEDYIFHYAKRLADLKD